MRRDLVDLIRSVSKRRNEIDPREVAKLVAKNTPQDQLLDFYADALVAMVRDVWRSERSGSLAKALSYQTSPSLETDTAAAPSEAAKSGRPDNYSFKIAACREFDWERCLGNKIHVGKSRWKLFGDATREDLGFVVSERELMVARIGAEKDLYAKVLAAMVEYDVNVVRDLPPDAIP